MDWKGSGQRLGKNLKFRMIFRFNVWVIECMRCYLLRWEKLEEDKFGVKLRVLGQIILSNFEIFRRQLVGVFSRQLGMCLIVERNLRVGNMQMVLKFMRFIKEFNKSRD